MKWLITSDIHIDDYPQFNPETSYRLNQFITLAHRYVEIAKKDGIKVLFMAGDIINKPRPRPKEIHVLDQFLSILSSYFDKIYYVLGQHDVDTKNPLMKLEDSIINIYTKHYNLETVPGRLVT